MAAHEDLVFTFIDIRSIDQITHEPCTGLLFFPMNNVMKVARRLLTFRGGGAYFQHRLWILLRRWWSKRRGP